jgi:tetratricopeptide (TPR) repeat protein
MKSLAGYAAEIARIEQDIADIGEAALSVPEDTERLTKYVYRHYQKAAISGDLRALAGVEALIDRAIPLLANPGDLYLLKANLAFKFHRLADVGAALASVEAMYDSRECRMIRADLDFQHGRYEEARRAYCDVLDAEQTWDALARLAHFNFKMGAADGADRLYAEAEDLLTAKQMRSYAWLEVQRGLLDFMQGRYGQARDHYDHAEAAYPGYWLVGEHVAELLGAQGRHGEAAAILERVAAAVDRPDLEQALGELHDLKGDAETAQFWKQKALAAYLQSAQDGHVHFYHHLADYYVDVAEDGAEAVKWARMDLGLRENFSTQSALAWALHRDGKMSEALCWIDRALSSGAVEAKLFFQAGAIYMASGDEAGGRGLTERARSLNPTVDHFHIHH